jgi:lysozyme
MMAQKRSLKQKAGLAALCVSLVGGFEGIRQIAYRDPVGIPTACFGETKNVRMGMKFTMAECNAMLLDSLEIADKAVDHCVKVPLPNSRRAALISFTYNVGADNFCRSTLVKKLNAGDTVGACEEFPRWVYAKGIKLPGLVNRRNAERDICMRGLT